MAQAVASVQRAEAISLLLGVGALKAQVLRVTPELLEQRGSDPMTPMLSYVLTPFGHALVGVLADTMGIFDPRMRQHIEAAFGKSEGAA